MGKYQRKNYYETCGRQIEDIRKWKLQMTQTQIAEAIGIMPRTYRQHIHGITPWKPAETQKLIELGVPEDLIKTKLSK